MKKLLIATALICAIAAVSYLTNNKNHNRKVTIVSGCGLGQKCNVEAVK